MSVRRIFVEKKPDYAVKAGELREELVSYLGITGVKSVRVLIRYDIENLSEDTYKKALGTIFSEPPVDFPSSTCRDSLIREQTLPCSVSSC